MTSSDLSLRPSDRTARFLCAALFALATLAALAAPRASAISDAEELTRFGGEGSGAGELSGPKGVATDPVTGHLYVVDQNNNRIGEFTPWGNFVKAFGWDVAPGAVNEQQEVRIRASTGQFKLSFGASTTPDLAFNAPGSASEGPGSVEAALNALPSIGGAGGEASVKAVPGTPDGKAPTIYAIVFKGSLAGTNVAELTIANGTTPLSGGDPSTVFEARTRADGTAGSTGLESCTAESGCKAGTEGAGVGQLGDFSGGVAVDDAGELYVREASNRRVQKFDSAGRFVLMFGGEVNKTTSANRCTKADLEGGDVCGAGVAGAGDGQFGASLSRGIALGAGGKLFVGDIERVQRFNSEGEWEASVPVSVSVSNPPTTVQDLAIAPGSGDFYAIVGEVNGTEPNVRILDATTGAEKGKLQASKVKNSKGEEFSSPATSGPIAIDPAGNVFALRSNINIGGGEFASPLLQFDAAGKQTSEFGRNLSIDPFSVSAKVEGSAVNAIGTFYVSSGVDTTITAYGPGPVRFEAPPPLPPTILAQFATSVERTGAVLSTEINPHFWSDTRIYVQYGEGKCSGGGCTSEKPIPPGALLGTTPVDAAVKSSGIFLEGLKPGTTYHYRFVAESLGGGPVYGIDPDGEGPGEASEEEGLEATFVTPGTIAPKACANDLFRGGGAARLPNCRAFEMVSPVDKNNGDIKALINLLSAPTSVSQSAEDGNRMTYSSYRSFADPKAAPFTNQLLATRTEGGWLSEGTDPPQGTLANQNNFAIIGNNFKHFSADLCTGWLVVAPEPQLDPPRDTKDQYNLYRRDNCGASKESYEALILGDPEIPELQGASAGGGAAIFRAERQLTPEAASGPWQAYYASEGDLRLLCILPNGAPSGGNCSGGTGEVSVAGVLVPEMNRLANVDNAISADGSRVYWTDSATRETGAGKVYLRINPGEEQSALSGGECTEPEKACTVKVSETKTSRDSRFLTASSDGSQALYEVTDGLLKGDLYFFDAESASSSLIAGDILGLAGASDDLSRIYFVSEEVLDDGAKAKQPNLYLREEEENIFIARLSDADAVSSFGPGPEEQIPSVTARKPIYHAARVTPDGSALAFISTEPITGYDNTDQVTGQADSEVYLYRAGAPGPVCVSCNPSGARPQGRVVKLRSNISETLPIAATLTLPATMLHDPRSISADGSRLFFNSFDALLPRDTNNKTDVYMWESAASKAACAALGAELYVESAAGCISLISNGESTEDSEFLDASVSGDDAFFVTNASLLGYDPGLFDVYDARAGGGLPAPPVPAPDCQGDTCKAPVTAPDDPTPASLSFAGAGDPASAKPRTRCAKGKARRKGRCVTKHKRAGNAAKRKRANTNRRASR